MTTLVVLGILTFGQLAPQPSGGHPPGSNIWCCPKGKPCNLMCKDRGK